MASDEDEDLLDVEAAAWEPLSAEHPQLAELARHAFLDHFFEVSNLSRRRRSQASEILAIDLGTHPDGDRTLRFEFGFTGATRWYPWGETDAEALSIAAEAGENNGTDYLTDPHAYGETGWEPKFDHLLNGTGESTA